MRSCKDGHDCCNRTSLLQRLIRTPWTYKKGMNMFYRKCVFFNTDQATIDFFDNVHHFQNGDGIETIILKCLTTVLFQTESAWNAFLLPILSTWWVIYFALHKALTKLFTSWIAFVVNKECMESKSMWYSAWVYIPQNKWPLKHQTVLARTELTVIALVICGQTRVFVVVVLFLTEAFW